MTPTTRFEAICGAFAQGLLDKTRAHQELDLSRHQRARLRESIGGDVRKLGDMLFPEVRAPLVSAAAAELAPCGIDLRQQTWQSQPRFDLGRLVFHYEHMAPVAQIVEALKGADSPDAVVRLLGEGMRLAWITKDEDRRLTALGYSHRRPDPEGAYREAGIVLLPLDPQ